MNGGDCRCAPGNELTLPELTIFNANGSPTRIRCGYDMRGGQRRKGVILKDDHDGFWMFYTFGSLLKQHL